MFLTDDELRELTKRTRPKAQATALDVMGIKYLRRGDGSLAVPNAHVEGLLGAAPDAKVKNPKQPNWSALANAT